MYGPYCPPELAEMLHTGMFPLAMMGRQGALPPPPQFIPPGMPIPFIHPFDLHQLLRRREAEMAQIVRIKYPGLQQAGMAHAINDSPAQLRKLFIGGLSHDTTDDQLGIYFSQWGPVVDAIVIRDPNTKHSRGFGFVTFASVFSAEAAMKDRPHIVGGKTVDSKRAIPREQMTALIPPPFFECDPAPGCKLLLSGIVPAVHSVDALRIYFETFGTLDQVEILGQPRGLGFVIYEDKESADKCLAHNNGRHIVNERKIDVRTFGKAASNTWRRPQPPPALYEQLSQLQISNGPTQRRPVAVSASPATSAPTTTNSTARESPKNFDEESSSYGGTTTEDDFNQFDPDAYSTSSDSTHPASS